MKKDTYRPLPYYLEIKRSNIEGYGLFSKTDLAPLLEVGISHVADDRFEDGYIRTPLGGFFNHSDDPNCEAYISGEFVRLRTIKRISSGAELTVKYWLYNMEWQ